MRLSGKGRGVKNLGEPTDLLGVVSFNWMKLFSHSVVHSNFEPFRNRCRRGDVMVAILGMNQSENVAMPKKRYKDLIVVGRGKLVTASVFLGFICRPSVEMM